MKNRIKWVFNTWKEHSLFVLFLLGFTVFSTVVVTAYPMLIKYIVDSLLESLKKNSANFDTSLRDKAIFMVFGLGFVRLIASLYPGFRFVMNSFFEKNLRMKYFNIMLHKGHHFFIHYRPGDLVTRLTDDISGFFKVAWFMCSGIFRAFNSFCIILFCIISMAYINGYLTLLAVLPFPFMIYLHMKIEEDLGHKFKQVQESISNTNSYLEKCFSGIRILKAYNASEREGNRFDEILEKRYVKEVDAAIMHGMIHMFFHYVQYGGQVIVLIAGGIMAIKGNITIGEYFAFYSYLGMIVYPLMDIPMLLVSSKYAFVTMDRLDEIEQFEKEFEDRDIKGKILDNIKAISLKNVNFYYKNTPDKCILKDINLEIKQGEKIAIMGKIGSGKSTVLKLIASILYPASGDILINDFKFKELDKRWYRSNLGYIGQETAVFSETVKKNISFWRDVDDDTLKKSAELAQFSSEIEQFNKGYEEVLGSKGVNISGGQKQRLCIARAVCQNPNILLMDDVTASLDAANEEKFWRQISQQMPDLTCIAVTHRLSTALWADKIIVLEKGEIIDIGTHIELSSRCNIYREICHI